MVSRRLVIVASLLLVAVALLGASGLVESAERDAGNAEPVEAGRLVQPTENGSGLWPYTSSGKSINQRTLAINVVVYGSDENVQRALTKRGELRFEPVQTENETAGNGTAANESADNDSDGSIGAIFGGDDETTESTAGNDTAPANDTASGNSTTIENATTSGNATALGNDTAPENDTNASESGFSSNDTFGSNGTRTPNETLTPNATLTPNETDPTNETGPANESRADNASKVVEIKATGIEWTDAHGAERYSYIDATPGEEGGGQWLEESYQLRTGPYLGSRLHVRAYASPTDNWTALQVHEDYWDWFRLRHTVPDTRQSARQVENDFIGEPYVEDVSRQYYGIQGGGSDGWLSVIELASAAIIFGGVHRVVGVTASGALLAVVAPETREIADQAFRRLLQEAYRQRGGITVAGVLAGLVLGVRVGGIALETAFPALHPKLIVALLYPLLALGMPGLASVERLVRDTDPGTAFGLVFAVVGAAFVADLVIIGVSAVPVGLLLHRCGLLIALGLVATGSTLAGHAGRQLQYVGWAAWIVGLVWPLLDFL